MIASILRNHAVFSQKDAAYAIISLRKDCVYYDEVTEDGVFLYGSKTDYV